MSGIKQLTLENWRDADPVLAAFARLDPHRGVVPMEADDWARLILSIDVSERAPEEIRTLFAVGRGTLLYGWFYYPLYVLGDEQLHRVAERAVTWRSDRLGAPSKVNSFAKRINWLVGEGVIPKRDVVRWDAIRQIRNMGSHPEFQRIGPPGQAVETLRILATSIDQVLGAGS